MAKDNDGDQKRFYWNEVSGQGLKILFVMPTKRSLNGKEILILPTVASGKKYISMKLRIVSIYG